MQNVLCSESHKTQFGLNIFEILWKTLENNFLDNNFLSKLTSGQIWCNLIVCVWGGGGGIPGSRVTQNILKHILVLEFLKSKEIFEIS